MQEGIGIFFRVDYCRRRICDLLGGQLGCGLRVKEKFLPCLQAWSYEPKNSLRYLRVWLRGKFESTSRPLAAFFLRQGKQGFFFGGSTPFLFAPSKRNGVEKAHLEIKTKSREEPLRSLTGFLPENGFLWPTFAEWKKGTLHF
ncbi:MAG: hypothetical protein LUD79_02175 [Oscillospiraceae bacterium]|nr:hypothetical protein [Oscillospiraceae bacterium]